MESLKISFAVLSGCGVWRPIKCSDRSNFWFTILQLIFFPLVLLFACLEFAMIVLVDTKLEETIEVLFILLSVINVICKSLSFMYQRKNIINLVNMLSTDLAIPQDQNEIKIRNNNRQLIRFVALIS